MGREAQAMKYFSKQFPELGPRETRVVVLLDDGSPPRGRYAFLEVYCEEMGCDCRRVLIQVVEESTPGKIWATINFGWGISEKLVRLLGPKLSAKFAFLDPRCQQSEHAEELLDLFKCVIDRDPAYLERLKRHYAMFKAAIVAANPSREASHSTSRAKRPKAELLLRRTKRR
jgi:hypothetical protein